MPVAELTQRLAHLSEAAWAAENGRKENDFEVFHNTTQHIVHRFTPGNRTAAEHYETRA